MKPFLPAFLLACCPLAFYAAPIDRHAVVERHNVVITHTESKSPAQVGNGEFAFGVDITGLQTFVPFNTMSQWGWHSFPQPAGAPVGLYEGVRWPTHGRMVRYEMTDSAHLAQSDWLTHNPHRINLGRIGLILRMSDGREATEADLTDCRQQIILWKGLIVSDFRVEGVPVHVETVCHPTCDMIAVRIVSPLAQSGRLAVRVSFPYADHNFMADYVGDWNSPLAHHTRVESLSTSRMVLDRTLDSTRYRVAFAWRGRTMGVDTSSVGSVHQFVWTPAAAEVAFTCAFAPAGTPFAERLQRCQPSVEQTFAANTRGWRDFWRSGAAVDLSASRDPRWRELERRIVLSQYLMRLNETGSLPPQESGLVNNGWDGRFHFEMIWWHMTHQALWGRWPLMEGAVSVYRHFLSTSCERAARQGYGGARWPKCTANFDRESPHVIHATLIWQQPHPLYFALLDYRLHPTRATLLRWRDVVAATADFMADCAWRDSTSGRYVLGPPLYIVSENTNPRQTSNPAFELCYWRFGLRVAGEWFTKLGIAPHPKWAEVAHHLAPLPVEEGVYVTHEGIRRMWNDYAFEHPALIGTLGMLPGDGVDTTLFRSTLDRVCRTWNFNRTWGWDFPMLAMASARAGEPQRAVDFLLHSASGFQFDVHGLATGGPFPYMPSNGALLAAVAMMAGGWDGSKGAAPGFPTDGSWTVRAEGFQKMP